MHSSLFHVAHRPWPLPAGPWIWRQSWLDATFLHYRVDIRELRPRIPSELRIQEFDGTAWVGLVPFRMADVMRRPLPVLPFLSAFPELNLRTYVEYEGKPGLWFFSLDADSWPIVAGGRHLYGLPYFRAKIRQRREGDVFRFSSMRRDGLARFDADSRPLGESYVPREGSFEHWAIERYGLYAEAPRNRGLTRVDIHHAPWALRRAEVAIRHSNMLAVAGIRPLGDSPVAHFSSGVHVVSYAPRLFEASRAPAFGTVAEQLNRT